jgi:hypothetical protein
VEKFCKQQAQRNYVAAFFETISILAIDTSWVDYPYKASTCDVMNCRQRSRLYHGGENLKYYLTPSPAVLSS